MTQKEAREVAANWLASRARKYLTGTVTLREFAEDTLAEIAQNVHPNRDVLGVQYGSLMHEAARMISLDHKPSLKSVLAKAVAA